MLVLAGGLAIFGLSQLLGTSGFRVTYLAAVVTGAAQYRARQQVSTTMMLTPVRLPPGRARLATRPVATGSPPLKKTIDRWAQWRAAPGARRGRA